LGRWLSGGASGRHGFLVAADFLAEEKAHTLRPERFEAPRDGPPTTTQTSKASFHDKEGLLQFTFRKCNLGRKARVFTVAMEPPCFPLSWRFHAHFAIYLYLGAG